MTAAEKPKKKPAKPAVEQVAPAAVPATEPTQTVEVYAGTTNRTTWSEFCADNEDCLDAVELALIQSVIEAGGVYFGGGGAEGLWTVRLARVVAEAA